MSEEQEVKKPRPEWTPESWTRWGRVSSVIDPLVNPPPWVSAEVSEALNKIGAGDSRMRRRTIIKVADAVASGTREIQDVLSDADTVGHSGWYQRIRREPRYQEVWTTCLSAAQAWYDQLEAQRLVRRAMRVEQTRDEMVSLTKQAVEELAALLLDEDTPAAVKERVAFGLLDRASEETATKSNQRVTVGPTSQDSMRDIRLKKRNRDVIQADSGSLPFQPKSREHSGLLVDGTVLYNETEEEPEEGPEFEDLDSDLEEGQDAAVGD